MLEKLDKWICESLLYIDFKQKEKGEDKFFRLAMLAVLSLTVYLNYLNVIAIISLILRLKYSIMEPIAPLLLSVITLSFLYIRYHYKENYINYSKKYKYEKKLWSTAVIYIIGTFALMWILMIFVIYTEIPASES